MSVKSFYVKKFLKPNRALHRLKKTLNVVAKIEEKSGMFLNDLGLILGPVIKNAWIDLMCDTQRGFVGIIRLIFH